MGLDQYVYKTKRREVKYWRNNNQLQGWFEQNCNQGNCIPTLLTVEVLEQLISDIKNSKLLVTQGFFYGNYELDEEEYQEMLEFFEDILKDTEENGSTYEYDCWY